MVLETLAALAALPSARKFRAVERETLFPLFEKHVEYLLRVIKTRVVMDEDTEVICTIKQRLPYWHEVATCHEVALNEVCEFDIDTHENERGTEAEFMGKRKSASRDLVARYIWEMIAEKLVNTVRLDDYEPYNDLEQLRNEIRCPYCNDLILTDVYENTTLGYHMDGTRNTRRDFVERLWNDNCTCTHFACHNTDDSTSYVGAFSDVCEKLEIDEYDALDEVKSWNIEQHTETILDRYGMVNESFLFLQLSKRMLENMLGSWKHEQEEE